MRSFKLLDLPNYSFDLIFKTYRFRIYVRRTVVGTYVSVYDLKADHYLCEGRKLVHGLDVFDYVKVPDRFVYVNYDGVDTNLLNGEFILDEVA